MDDGTTGNCFGDTCQNIDFGSNDNCGQYGLTCPQGEACTELYGYGYCSNDAGINTSCTPTTVCPSGDTCFYGDCVKSKCTAKNEGQPCELTVSFSGYQYQTIGVCCDSTCLAVTGTSPQDYAPYDDHHCGGCGIDCGSDASCLPSYSYETGYTYSCVPSSCGKHDDGAACALPDGGSYYGQTGTCCSGTCSDLYQDANCGACGLACPSGLECYYGYCANESNGQITDCTTTPCPSGWACLYGYYCAPQSCKKVGDNGICVADDGNAGTCCGGSCVNRYGGDNKNCGTCGNVCPSGTECRGGSCAAVVDCSQNADSVSCDINGTYGTCCEGQCVSYGTCGIVCRNGDELQNGICVHKKSGKPDYTGCTEDSQCPDGYGCLYGSCYQTSCPSGYDNAPCAFAGASGNSYGQCCGGQCVDIYNDSSNCGGCGGICVNQTTCQYGGCYGPNFGFVTCTNDECPSGDACGYYGAVCRTASCKGADEGTACAYGLQNSFGYSYVINGTCCSGTCVSTNADSSNCGACGASCGTDSCSGYGYCTSTSCSPACKNGEVCANGVCVGSVCDPVPVTYFGPPACAADDGTVGSCCGGGACEEIQSDSQNCGGCGIKCPEGDHCKKGMCSSAGKTCTPDRLYAFCDVAEGDFSKICCPGIGCADTGNDVHNCGGCGVGCADGQVCTAGVCGPPTGGARRATQQ
jgi:hypothetical protein